MTPHPRTPILRPRGAFAAVTLAVALSLTPTDASAGAFYLPERGARALSMGGAFVAGADDLNAQWMNPAGLTRLSRDLTVSLDAGLILTDQSFTRADHPEVLRKDPRFADGFPTVDNEGGPFVSPSLGVATNLGLEDWVFALGVYGPYAGANAWPADGPQRYSLVKLDALELFGQLTAAWRVSDAFAIGVGLQWVVTSIRQQIVISAYPGVFGWAEQPDLDVFAEVDVTDSFEPGANLGVLITPHDHFEIGLSVQLPIFADAEGSLDVRLPPHYYFSDVTVRGDALELGLTFPLIMRLGLRAFDAERWSVELAAVYEMWSIGRDIDVRPGPGGIAFEDVPGIGTYRVDPFRIEQGYDDVISLRLGGFYTLSEAVRLRAGALFETSALPDETLSVLKYDANKFGVSVGATFTAGPVAVDLACAYLGFVERDVTTSTKRQVNPLYDEDPSPYGDTGPNVVGDGTYSGGHVILATTVSVAID